MNKDFNNPNLRNGLKIETKIEKTMEEKFDMLTHSDVYVHAGCKRCLARFIHGASGPNEFWFMRIGHESDAELIEGREDSEHLKIWECPICHTVLYFELEDDGTWEGTSCYTNLS